MQVLSTILTVLSFVMIGVMILTFRKVRSISSKSPLIAVTVSIIALSVYAAIVGTSLPLYAVAGILVLGLLFGWWQGKNTRVWIDENNRRKAQNTIWFLVIWATCYGINQLLVTLGQSASLNIGFGAMSLGTGVTLGTQVTLLLRLRSIRGDTACPACGTVNVTGRRFCAQCGHPLIAEPVPAAVPSEPAADIICPYCNTTNRSDRNYCLNCGRSLIERQV
jgi:hypothetical protein